MANNVTTYLKYANLQMAAEAFLDDPESYFKQLTSGNNHSSKFTDIQAQQFIDDGWTVVEHKSNTSTGFSGTLFKYSGETDPARGLVKGEMVLSFRSTEFIDDAARDNQATNAMEMNPYGWAFGQIADMEQWYGHLQQTYGLGATNRFSVTGYSLGGHLATAFNLLHPSDVNQTYTFNSAGVGRTQNGISLAATIQQFNAQRSATVDLGSLFTDPSVRSLYESLRSTLQGGGTPTDAQRAAIAAITPLAVTVIVDNIPVKVQVPNRDLQAQMLIEAFNRVLTIQSEMARVGTLHSGSTDSLAPQCTVTPALSAANDCNARAAA
ncbi:MAG: hypothetical protein JF606_15120 [Burkholderiales bacterium]|jgi:pimeloyl-ACP methyl ester carboxylesterase|nr:hypothetical protein [Burkholderiales bacterium]